MTRKTNDWWYASRTVNEKRYPRQRCEVCGRRFRIGGIQVGGQLRCVRCYPSYYADKRIDSDRRGGLHG